MYFKIHKNNCILLNIFKYSSQVVFDSKDLFFAYTCIFEKFRNVLATKTNEETERKHTIHI